LLDGAQIGPEKVFRDAGLCTLVIDAMIDAVVRLSRDQWKHTYARTYVTLDVPKPWTVSVCGAPPMLPRPGVLSPLRARPPHTRGLGPHMSATSMADCATTASNGERVHGLPCPANSLCLGAFCGGAGHACARSRPAGHACATSRLCVDPEMCSHTHTEPVSPFKCERMAWAVLPRPSGHEGTCTTAHTYLRTCTHART